MALTLWMLPVECAQEQGGLDTYSNTKKIILHDIFLVMLP